MIPSGHRCLMIFPSSNLQWKGGEKKKKSSEETNIAAFLAMPKLVLLLSPRAEHAGCFSAAEPSWHGLMPGCHSKLVPSLLFLQTEDVLVPAPATEGLSRWSLSTAHPWSHSPCSRLLDFLLQAVRFDHDPSHHPSDWRQAQEFKVTQATPLHFEGELLLSEERVPLFGHQENSDFSKSSHKST